MSDNKILVGDMSRKQCLEVLKRLLEAMETFDGISPSPERINALKMAIASLEVDEAYQLEYESTTKNDLGVDWENCKDVDGNSLDDLILEVLQNNFDCGNTYGYKVADEIIGLLSSVTPQEPFINKPCVSEKQCEHDKNVVLDKIRAEIEKEADACNRLHGISEIGLRTALKIIDKYKAESEQ